MGGIRLCCLGSLADPRSLRFRDDIKKQRTVYTIIHEQLEARFNDEDRYQNAFKTKKVAMGGLEPPTSAIILRSNQLSYIAIITKDDRPLKQA